MSAAATTLALATGRRRDDRMASMDAAPRIRRTLLAEGLASDPLVAIAMAPGEPAFYWRSDARDIEIAALGAVDVIESSGVARFDDAAACLARLRARVDGPDVDLPLAVGGFAFDDATPSSPWDGFPALRFFVPRVLWIRRGGERRLLVASSDAQTPLSLLGSAAASRPAGPGEDAARWKERVEAAVRSIRSGELAKIVLARRCSVPAAGSVEALLRALCESRPGCFTFLVRWNGRAFAGSSPERLLRKQGELVEADALAGTAPRGLSKSHDESLARELFASAKERREHAIVVDAIRASLAPLCDDVESAAEPSLLVLPEAQHLHTAVRARLAAPLAGGVFSVAGLLHPTPAVCGLPRDAACRQLAAEEPGRGWYGGAIGWASACGDGELAVALRAALLHDGCAEVWAGAGIVDGSSAERELDETERKMRSILPLLGRGDDECAA